MVTKEKLKKLKSKWYNYIISFFLLYNDLCNKNKSFSKNILKSKNFI